MSVLSQGMAPTNKIPVAPDQLPAPKETLELLPPTSGPRHQFVLPPNLEGQAPVLRPGRRPAAATRERPIAPTTTAPGTAPNPTAPGTAQPMSAHLGNLVLNPDNTLSLVLAAPGVSTPSAGPAQLGSALGAPVSRFTERNRRRRALEEESGVSKRRYLRGVAYNTCGTCGQPKTKEFGHSRYDSATFCPQASQGKSLEEWLKEQRAQK